MKKNHIWYLLLVIIAVFAIFACSKDDDSKKTTVVIEPDEDNPIVNIFSPVNNTVFNVIDAVNVEAFVADSGEIAEVSLYVNDALINTIMALPWEFEWREATVPDLSDSLVVNALLEQQGTYKITVKAVDVTGNEAMSAPVYVHLGFGNTPPTEPGTPIPQIGATNVQVANPVLSWVATDNDVDDTILYDLAYGNMADLSDAVIVSDLTVNSYQIDGDILPFETDFFWQVTAKDSIYDVKGPIWNFTTILPLDLPVEPSPDNEDEDIAITNITFEWECENFADNSPITYELYFGDDIENLAMLAEGLTTPEYTYTSTLNYHTEYFWRVKAIDQYFPNGMMSSLWSFTTRHAINDPSAPIPANDSSGNTVTNLQLGWTCGHQNEEPLTYQVIISTLTNFELTDYYVVNVDGLTSNSYTVPVELTYSKKYYWKVYAKAGADSLEGTLWTFKTVNPLSVVSPVLEEENVSILDVDFEWAMMDIGVDVTYDFYISTTDALDALAPKVGYTNLTNTSLVYPLSNAVDPDTLSIGTTYYWRIRAKHGTSGDDNYFTINSNVWSFTTKENPISAPSAPQPANNAVDILVANPSFSWTASHVDGTVMTYDLWFGPDEFSLTKIASDLSQTTYTYNTILDFSREYRWKVVAKDGIFENESSLWRFDTIVPFGNPKPATGEVGISVSSVVLDWERINYNEPGMVFDVYVTTDEDEFSVSSTQPVATGLTVPHYEYTGMQENTKYYWKVKAINSDQSTESDVWNFTTRPETLLNWVSISGGTYDVGTPDEDGFYQEETIGNFQLTSMEITNLAYKIYLKDALASGEVIIQGTNVKDLNGMVLYNMGDASSRITIPVGLSAFIITEGYENHPVTQVSWYGALAFANHYGYRLPTEWEWEIAARGGTVNDYPWGNNAPETNTVANYRNSGDMFDNGTTPVGYFPAYHNLYDMSGNVWEWTSSDGDLVGTAQYKVLRGGSWNSTVSYLKCWVRNFDGTKNYNPTYTGNTIGFRCAQ